jgi:Sigma-70, region 4
MRRRAKRDRKLRRAVSRLRGCLGALDRNQRRVLVLRAGLGEPRPRPRASVARILDVSSKRVARLERRGLRELKRLARQDCGAVDAGAGPATVDDDSQLASASVGTTVAGDDGEASSDRGAVKGEHAEQRAKRRKPRSPLGGFGSALLPKDASPSLAIPIGALALLLVAGGVYLFLRRRRRIQSYNAYR